MSVRAIVFGKHRRIGALPILPLLTAGALIGAQHAALAAGDLRPFAALAPALPAVASPYGAIPLDELLAGMPSLRVPLGQGNAVAPLDSAASYSLAATGSTWHPTPVPMKDIGGLSGLPWPSGAACGGPDFEAWRGHKQDVQVTFAPIDSFPNVVAWFDNWNVQKLSVKGPPVSVGLGLLTEDTRTQMADCANGAFDDYFKQIGTLLVQQATGNAHIRLGWEANGKSFPWNAYLQVDAYKACFRRAVAALRSTAPAVKIDWQMNRKTKAAASAVDMYPGDDVVDTIGLSLYDRIAVNSTQAVWDKMYNEMQGGGPAGLGTWLTFAKTHHKKFMLGEWAISNGVYDGTDNPLFIRNMYGFLKANATNIAYDSYFNCPKDAGTAHLVYPPDANPNASAAYQSAWAGNMLRAVRSRAVTGRRY